MARWENSSFLCSVALFRALVLLRKSKNHLQRGGMGAIPLNYAIWFGDRTKKWVSETGTRVNKDGMDP